MASGVFGLRKVYKKQVQNVTDNNFASWPEGATRGYYGGGYNPSLTQSNFLRIDFNTETVDFTPNILPEQMTFSGSVSNPNGTYGYLAGSQILSSCKIRRLDFSNETVSQPGYDLPEYKSKSTGLQSDSYGYFGGGYAAPNTYFSTIVKLDFSNDTTSPVSATLSQKKDQAAGSSSSLYGYIVAGYGPPPSPPPAFVFYCNISRLDFSNETLNESAVGDFPFGTTLMSGTQSSQAGYFTGGTSFPYNCTITRLDFSSETLSDPGGTLTRGTAAMATVQNNFSAYFGGGYSPPGITYRSSIYKLDFASETVSNPVNYATPPTNNLRKNSAGISGGQSVARGNGYRTYGYWAGGGTSIISPYNLQSSIARQDFSTSSISVIDSNLLSWSPGAAGKKDLAAMSSNNYGYFVGGDGTTPPTTNNYTSDATRIDFSNETTRRYPAFYTGVSQINGGVREASGAQSSHYGYIAGGYGKNPLGTALAQRGVLRMDFETETTVGPSNLQLTTRMSNGAAVQSSDEAYFGGGLNPPPSSAYTDEIRKFVFANETRSISPMVLSSIRYAFAGASNNNYGYFGGGAPGDRSQADRVDFSTETLSPNQAFIAPAKKTSHSATSDGFYAYFGGGSDNTGIGCKIFRFDYSTETHTTYTDLPTIRYPKPGTVSN